MGKRKDSPVVTAEIRILHAEETRAFALRVAAALAAAGYSVSRAEAGAPSPLMRAADVVVAVWSPGMADAPGALTEARAALARRCLVPIAIGRAEPPPAFSHLGPIDLIGWAGQVEDARWRFVLDEIELALRRKEQGGPELYCDEDESEPQSAPAKFPIRTIGVVAAALAFAAIAAAAVSPFIAARRDRAPDAPSPLIAYRAEPAAPAAESPPPEPSAALLADSERLASPLDGAQAAEAEAAPAPVPAPPQPLSLALAPQAVSPDAVALPAPEPDDFLGNVFRDCSVCPDMAEIPAGPAGPFALSRREVTMREWDACVADGGCGQHTPADLGWGRRDRPAIFVSWRDAAAYVDWLSEKSGRRYRLPTEPEWAHAAAADVNAAGAGNVAGALTLREDASVSVQMTAPVGRYGANPFGLYDMAGNVREWVDACADAACGERVLAGGAYDAAAGADARLARPDVAREADAGFRVARDLE